MSPSTFMPPVLVATLLLACGGEAGTDAGASDAGGVADAGPIPSDGGEVDAGVDLPDAGPPLADAGPDTTPPTIVESAPSDETSPFSRIADLTARASEPLRPESITDATVQLFDQNGRPVPGEVSYESETQTIRFNPTSALREWWGYRFRIDAVEDAVGNALEEAVEVEFETYAPLRREGRALDAAGDPSGVIVTRWDAERRPLDARTFFEPGPDAVFGTGDDILGSLETSRYPTNQLRETVRWLRGDDGELDTSDDAVSFVLRYLDDHRFPTRFETVRPGPDDELGTADDLYTRWQTSDRDGLTGEVRTLVFAGLGPDGERFTSDDEPGGARLSRTDVHGVSLQSDSINDPGPDGAFFTADDIYRSRTTATYSSDGTELHRVRLDGGFDQTVGTADDVETATIDRLDSDGLVSVRIRLTPGPDDTVLTGDDEIVSFRRFARDANGNATRETNFNDPGPDGVWMTADDVVAQEDVITYQ